MKKILQFTWIVVIAVTLCFLTGCNYEEEEENPNALTLSSCMQDASLEKSEYGKRLTYCYIGPDEISLYYIRSWKNRVVGLKRYFATEEQYNTQKALYENMYKDINFNDKKLLITIKEFVKVENIESYWEEIKNSTIYTIVE